MNSDCDRVVFVGWIYHFVWNYGGNNSLIWIEFLFNATLQQWFTVYLLVDVPEPTVDQIDQTDELALHDSRHQVRHHERGHGQPDEIKHTKGNTKNIVLLNYSTYSKNLLGQYHRVADQSDQKQQASNHNDAQLESIVGLVLVDWGSRGLEQCPIDGPHLLDISVWCAEYLTDALDHNQGVHGEAQVLVHQIA